MKTESKKTAAILITLCIVALPAVLSAQNTNINMNTLVQQGQTITQQIITIVKFIAGAVMAAGIVWVMYNIITGKPNSMASIGSMIGGIAIFTLLMIFFP